jgi:UTP--glucose-1-phosphate uridylyltransferase
MNFSPLRKAVIPAAGFGTRMLPVTKAVPKEMLPVLDRPTIELVVEEAAAIVDDILLVTARDKRAVEDHFDRNNDLENRIKSSGKQALLASLEKLMARVKIHSVRQADPRGLGDAVAQARRHVGREPFFCLLGDTVFSDPFGNARQMAAAYQQFGTSIIGLEEVPAEKVNRYGIVGGEMLDGSVMKINALVEKPHPDKAPSRYAIAARYILTPAIFDCLEQTPAGVGGEIQLTDAMRILLEREPIHGVILKAKRYDVGNPFDWLVTNLEFAKNDPSLWKDLGPILRGLLGE